MWLHNNNKTDLLDGNKVLLKHWYLFHDSRFSFTESCVPPQFILNKLHIDFHSSPSLLAFPRLRSSRPWATITQSIFFTARIIRTIAFFVDDRTSEVGNRPILISVTVHASSFCWTLSSSRTIQFVQRAKH